MDYLAFSIRPELLLLKFEQIINDIIPSTNIIKTENIVRGGKIMKMIGIVLCLQLLVSISTGAEISSWSKDANCTKLKMNISSWSKDAYCMGIEMNLSKMYPDALFFFKSAIRQDPNNIEAWIRKGMTERRIGIANHDRKSLNNSLASYYKAIELNGMSVAASDGKKEVLKDIKNYNETSFPKKSALITSHTLTQQIGNTKNCSVFEVRCTTVDDHTTCTNIPKGIIECR
jgi:hypothetical protein